ncbi:MAG: hypothetical protein RLZZ90_808 [Actinomycetota bacterium]|jgi:phosphocarrier protein HPr
MIRETVSISTADGLHARPAAEFVRAVQLSEHRVMISKGGGPMVRADSILAILGLGLKQGEKMVVEVVGPDEKTLLQSLKSIVNPK